MSFLSDYLILGLLVYAMNVVPFFMPPTWIVLAFFSIKMHLLLIPLVIIGATFAILGRITLYVLTRQFFHPFLSKRSQENLQLFGKFVNLKKHMTFPIFIFYAFLPIPSNHVYIAAALAKVNIRLLATAFFLGRLISYSFWITVSSIAVKNLESIFNNHFSNPKNFLIEIFGFSILYLFVKINWKKILKSVIKHK